MQYRNNMSATEAIKVCENSYYCITATFEGSITLPLEKMTIPDERRCEIEGYVQTIRDKIFPFMQVELMEEKVMGIVNDGTDTVDDLCDYLTDKIVPEVSNNPHYLSIFEQMQNALQNRDINYVLEVLDGIKELAKLPQKSRFSYTVTVWMTNKSDVTNFLKRIEALGEPCKVNVTISFDEEDIK